MINVTYSVNDNTHNLTVFGHANYAEKGSDIVCAGVSALVQALVGWLGEHSEYADFVSIDELHGEVVIDCTGGEDVAAVFLLTAIGLEQIANTYPDNVQIEIIGLAD
jgi:uncharacterized protein YsxB (DUF464 family)